MKVKRVVANTMRDAMNKVRQTLGSDAVIISSRQVGDSVEIVTALDYDEALFNKHSEEILAQTRSQHTGISETKTLYDDDIKSSDPHVLVSMNKELVSLREMLSNQISGLAWGQLKARNPMQAYLLKQLTELGLSHSICGELVRSINCNTDIDNALSLALQSFGRQLRVTDNDILTTGGVVALVGPTGVGKTTTIAKLAALYASEHGKDSVALISTDYFGVGSHEQLRTFAKVLGVQIRIVNNSESLLTSLDCLDNKSLVLIDTAGLSRGDVQLVTDLQRLHADGRAINIQIVLSAVSQRRALQSALKAFGPVNFNGCIITKTDEAVSLGEALSLVYEQNLPVSYMTDGQQIPDSLQIAKINSLIDQLVGIAESNKDSQVNEELLAITYGDELIAK